MYQRWTHNLPQNWKQTYVYTKSIRKLYGCYIKTHKWLSHSSFNNLKPFYITPPSVRGMESCCSTKCMNPHGLYNAIKKSSSKFPDWLTEYITSKFNCEKDKQTFKLDCIKGACESVKYWMRHLIKIKKVNYTIFETVSTLYYNKQGEQVSYNRTARVDKKASLHEIYMLLMENAIQYLLHRYFVSTDKIFWSKFQFICTYPICYFDYSLER